MKTDSYEKWKNQATSLADDYLEAGKAREAQSLLKKVLRVHPEEIDCRMKLARTMLALGETASFRAEGLGLSLWPSPGVSPDQRLEILNALCAKFPNDLNIKLKAAELAHSSGRHALAEPLYHSLAEVYLTKALPMRAIRIYERLLEMTPDKFETLGKMADIYIEQGVFDKAIARLLELADTYADRGMLKEASAAFERIFSIDPVNEAACLPLAKIHVLRNEIKEASKVMTKQIENHLDKGRIEAALELSEGFAELLAQSGKHELGIEQRERMAEALLARGKKKEAVRLFDKVAEAALGAGDVPKFIDLSERQIKFHREKDEYAQIAAIYQKMVLALYSINPEKAGSLLDEFVRDLLKREQIAALDQSLRMLAKEFENRQNFEESEKTLIRLGDVYAELYRTQEAIRIFEAMAHRGTGNSLPYLRLADLYVQESNLPRAMELYAQSMDMCLLANDPSRAESIFKTASAKDPKNPALLSKMGHVYYTIGEWDKALKFYEKAMTAAPGHRQAVVGMAMAYAKKGMLDEMVSLAKRLVAKGLIAEIVEEYRKALSLTGGPSECAMALGVLYKDLGFMEEAIIEFQNASKDPKFFLRACNLLGLCFKEQGFAHLAIRQFQKALESQEYGDEDLLEIRYNLAVTCEEAKMIKEACELYNDILVLDIGYKDVKSRFRKLKNIKAEGKIISLERGQEGKKS